MFSLSAGGPGKRDQIKTPMCRKTKRCGEPKRRPIQKGKRKGWKRKTKPGARRHKKGEGVDISWGTKVERVEA